MTPHIRAGRWQKWAIHDTPHLTLGVAKVGDTWNAIPKGSTAFIYTGDPGLRKDIGLKTSRRYPLVNGKLEGVLVKIESYEGSKKRYYADYKAAEQEQGKAEETPEWTPAMQVKKTVGAFRIAAVGTAIGALDLSWCRPGRGARRCSHPRTHV
jgi:hypothetical protein